MGFTVKLTARAVLPAPLLVLVNETVSEYVFTARLLALALMDTVTLVVAPAASVPPVAESVSQLAVLVAVQFNDPEPLLVRV